MPFYSSNEKLKRKRIAKESNKQLNIGSGSGEETTQPTETFTYREPKLFFNLNFTGRFLNNIQVSDYPRRFRSVNPTLPLTLNSVSIVQNFFQVSIDEENSNFNIYPNKPFQQMVDDGDISIKWFMDSVEVVGETDASLALDENNGDQGKTVYAEVTNNVDTSVVTSNTITVVEVWTPSGLTSLTLWLDASDESTITKDSNNRVSQWNDKSDLQNHVVCSNTSYQPTYSNGKISVNNKNTWMTPNNNLSSSIISIHCKYKFEDTGGSWNTLFCYSGGGTHHLLINDSTKEIGFYNNLSGSGWYSSGFSLTINTTYIISLIKNGSNVKLWIDGVLVQNNNSGFDNNTRPLGIFFNYISTGEGTQGSLGKFYGIIATEGVEPTTQEREDIEAYLNK